MSFRRTTFSTFIIEHQRRNAEPETDLTALLNDIQTACKFIALAVSRGALHPVDDPLPAGRPDGSVRAFDLLANDIVLRECARGGTLAGMTSEAVAEPIAVPDGLRRGPYLLVFDPLDGAPNLDVNVSVGTIFSILRAPGGGGAAEADFLQPGTRQVAAGYALHGPSSMIVLTLGDGVHGFTLDREIGAYTLTHPGLRIPETTREFAINASNERYWEEPVRHYVDECVQGRSGPRGEDFTMRWVASTVAEVHRILVRGGLFVAPRESSDAKAGRLRLLHEANPMALVVEQAGGLASTGRERILDVAPAALHGCVPVMLGSRLEVERLVRYHAEHDRGEKLAFQAPLFNARSMFRSV